MEHWPHLIVKPVHARYFVNRGHGAYEMNFGALRDIPDDGIVPNDRFYINSRGKPPKIENIEEWRLEVTGDAVRKPRSFTLHELKELHTTTIKYIMDCGTNGRGFFTALPKNGWPLPAGFPPWQWGAMGAAFWTGVPIEHLLKAVDAEHEYEQQSTWITAQSLDAVRQGHGEVRPFQHALPTANALERKTLLVFDMNHEQLPIDHGYPLRFFVPGYGANTNVKWLGKLIITRKQPPFSPTQKNETLVGPDYPLTGVPPALQNPKSCFELFAPRATMVLPHNQAYPQQSSMTFYGRAWSAPSTIKNVDIKIEHETTNGVWEPVEWPGQSPSGWWPAQIENKKIEENWWVRFYFEWPNPAPGSYRLASRAADAMGRVQPPGADFPWNQHALHWNGWMWQPLILLPLSNMP